MQENHTYPQFDFEIVDPYTPIAILYGARGSGKTMTWIRLTRYLKAQGYRVVPDPLFRPSYDKKYIEQCEKFWDICYKAPCNIDYMLLKVMDKRGRPICQLLELPGESYFDPVNLQKNFETSPSLEKLMNLRNPRIWIFMIELNAWSNTERSIYEEELDHIPHRLRFDKAIFTCHKIDMHSELFIRNDTPNTPVIFEQLKNQYPVIYYFLENKNPFTRPFKKYNCSFIPFSAGQFFQHEDGRLEYIQGSDIYPKLLCKAIIKAIRH